MMVIYTALYHEASPLIEHLRLHKATLPAPAPGRLQWFTGTPDPFRRPVHLIIGGTGPLAAAVGTTYAITRLLGDQQADTGEPAPIIFLNLGVAGSPRTDWPTGVAMLCHKIIHRDAERAYYPDILIDHPFREGVLETFSHVVRKMPAPGVTVAGDVVDMEGAGCFAAAAAFLPPHRMFFLKIVADHLDLSADSPSLTDRKASALDGEAVSRLIAVHIPAIVQLLMQAEAAETARAAPLLSREEEGCIHALAEQLRLSVTMSFQLRQLCLHYKAGGGQDLPERLRPWLTYPVKNKHERNAVFAQIRRTLLPD